MEIRKITKTDGKRLFIEIGKNMRKSEFLPELKKGDEVLLLPLRKLSKSEMDRLIGKYISYYDLADDESHTLKQEGIVKLNKEEYWDKNDEYSKSKRYVLIDPELGPNDVFDNLDEKFDLKVFKNKELYINKVECDKCKKKYFEGYKYCPFCGKYNKLYKKEE